MLISYAEMTTLIVGLIIAGIPALIGWMLYLKDRADFQRLLPWVYTALKAARTHQAVMLLHHPSSNIAEMILCKRDKKGSVIIDDPTIGLHFSPESSGRCRPTKLNGLDVYFGDFITPNCLSHDDVVQINKIYEVRKQFPRLRTLSNQTLISLFSQPERDWQENAQSILTALRAEKLPDKIYDLSDDTEAGTESLTADELYHELKKAYRVYVTSNPPADAILTTYESIKRREQPLQKTKSLLSKKSKSDKKQGNNWLSNLFSRKKDKEPQGTDETINYEDEIETNLFVPDRVTKDYVYLNAQRIPCGFRQYSVADAIASNNAPLTSNLLELYGTQVEIRTIRKLQKSAQDKIKENAPLAITIVMILIGAAVAFMIVKNYI